jgi:hypothetical protein
VEEVAVDVWTWLAVGLILLGAEVLAPVALFLGMGVAALGCSLLCFCFDIDAPLQLILFALLACLCTWLGRNYISTQLKDPQERGINRSIDRLLGETFALEEAVGSGPQQVKVGGSLWLVQSKKGQALSAGCWVCVVEVKGNILYVEPLLEEKQTL